MNKLKTITALLISILFIGSNNISAKGLEYIGGMMIHGGYSSSGTLNVVGSGQSINVDGFTKGIGGRLLFKITNNFRLGSEGYVSGVTYGDHRTASLGWGGITGDYGIDCGRFRPTVGVSLGGGHYENICSVDTPLGSDIAQPTVWNSYALFLAVPYVAVEYSLTPGIKIYSRIDYITAPTTKHSDFSSGAKLHIGFMFAH